MTAAKGASPYLRRLGVWVSALLFSGAVVPARAAEWSGRLAVAGLTATAGDGDYGYGSGDNSPHSDQESLRLMGQGSFGANGEWEMHLRTVRLASHLLPTQSGFTDLFRADPLRGDLIDDSGTSNQLHWYYEADRLDYRYNFTHSRLTIGRQPISWGVGRFWQPTNLFGSFSPTELDTEYKPGVDTLTYDYYPGPFSTFTLAEVFAPQNRPSLKDSTAFHYRRHVGELSELSAVGGSVLGNEVLGGSLETSAVGMGLRLETLLVRQDGHSDIDAWWVAGADYQFDNAILVAVELYQNSLGATRHSEFARVISSDAYAKGLSPQLSRGVLGLSVSKDLTPLLNGSYTLLASLVSDAPSTLHQLTLSYSLSNEADVLVSLLAGTGKGLDASNVPQSEFGALPLSLTFRVQTYF